METTGDLITNYKETASPEEIRLFDDDLGRHFQSTAGMTDAERKSALREFVEFWIQIA